MTQLEIRDANRDYSGAAIRFATSMHEKVQRIVFAWVELYPHEVALPPMVHDHRNFGDTTLRFSVTPVDVDEALSWYGDVVGGSPIVPSRPQLRLEPVRLSAEPGWGRWTVGERAPFEPRWHGRARIHRLVSMVDPTGAGDGLTSGPAGGARWEKARRWLAERLHFDVLASDEWRGGCALLAPNPISRRLRHRVLERGLDGAERFRITAELRSGADLEDLSVRIVERRFGGIVHESVHRLDAFASVEVTFPQPVDHLGYDLLSDRLGLLARHPPRPLLRRVLLNAAVREAAVVVEIPSPKSGGPSTTYQRDVTQDVGTTVVGAAPLADATARLRELRRRTEGRTGSARPGGEEGRPDTFVFHGDREAAAVTIRRLLSGARRAVTFVDGYFDHVALREFALSIPNRDVKIRVLTEYRAERRDLDGSEVRMEALARELAAATAFVASRSLGTLEVRVTGGRVRKYHDRFLVIDDEVWHCGHSFNQVGRDELSAITRLRRPQDVFAMIDLDFDAAELFGDAHRRWLENEPSRSSALQVLAIKALRRVLARLEGRA